MFRRKTVPYENVESIISPGMIITGNISSQGSIRVDGNIEGTLDVKGDMILGEKGTVKGDVKAANLILAGKLEGNVAALERLEITSSGVMMGEVTCSVMTIEEGGILEGTTRMFKKQKKAESAPTEKTGATG
ncbi:MAG: bactofilin family protein [Syntrophomonadaceae bacterium]